MEKNEWFKSTGYTPHPGQQEMHDSDARFRLMVVGRRWGKTLSGTKEAEVMALTPNTRGWVVAKTDDMVRRVMEGIANDSPIAEKYLHHSKNMALEFPWGSTIEGLNEANLLAYRDQRYEPEIDWVVFDECAMCKPAVWDIILSALNRRIRRYEDMPEETWWRELKRIVLHRERPQPEEIPPRPLGKALLMTTPQGTDNWVWDKWILWQQPQAMDCWTATHPTWDNPNLQYAVETMRAGLSEPMFNQEVCGEFITKEEKDHDQSDS